MCGQALKMLKISFLELLLAICVRPGAGNAQNELPGVNFAHMCGQGLKMLKIFLGLLLAICAAGA